MDGLAAGVEAYGKVERAARDARQHIAEGNLAAAFVGNLNTHVTRARNRRVDTHAGCSKSTCDVVLQGGNPVYAHALARAETIRCERGALDPVDHMGIHAKLRKRRLQRSGGLLGELRVLCDEALAAVGAPGQCQRGKLVGTLVDGGILLACPEVDKGLGSLAGRGAAHGLLGKNACGVEVCGDAATLLGGGGHRGGHGLRHVSRCVPCRLLPGQLALCAILVEHGGGGGHLRICIVVASGFDGRGG